MDDDLKEQINNLIFMLSVAKEQSYVNALHRVLRRIKQLECDLKDKTDEIELLEQKLIRKTVRGYHEHTERESE